MIRILAGALCGLMLAHLTAASAEPQKHGAGYDSCYDPKHIPGDIEGLFINCNRLPPEEVARQRAETDARDEDLKRRYDEQQSLTVPTTKPDLILVCGLDQDTVNIWFAAGILTWGMGENREVWRVGSVSPVAITFKRVSYSAPGTGKLFDATGSIDRVSGQFLRDRGYSPYLPGGLCKPAEAKF
jgi:hypothetical protein